MRRGMNRLEFVVVLVILGVLLTLIGLAVPRVRAAAARAGCQNNLKQLGLAIHNYHDTHQHFPPGTMPNPDLPPDQRLSFHVAIYPFVESSPVYSRVAKDEAWDSPTNAAALNGRFKVHECPAHVAKGEQQAGATNYVGVAGAGADAATRPALPPGNGVFGYDRTVEQEDVKDGLENTAMLFETAHDVGPWCRGGPATVRAVAEGTVFGGTHTRRTWVLWTRGDGFNVALADASVRFTRPDADPTVLLALATIAAGEEVPTDW